MQMGSLSIATVIFVLALLNFAGAMIMAAYLSVAAERKMLGLYTINKLVQGLSWFLRFLETVNHDPIQRFLADFLLMAGFTFEALAYIGLSKKWKPKLLILYLSICVAASIIVLWPWNWTIQATIVSQGIVIALLLGFGAVHLLLQRPWSAFRTTLSLSFLFLPLIMIITFVFSGNDIVYLYMNPGPLGITLFVAAFTLQMLLIFGFILVAKEKDEAALRILAETDSLTGIYNRRAFFQEIQKQFSGHNDQAIVVSIILMDLDSFKGINDTHGHEIGDWVIQHFCGVVQASIREGDLFSRFGGEEFVLYLPKATRVEASAVASRIHERLHTCNSRKDDTLPAYTVSLGICTGTAVVANDIERILSRSDRALYYSKENGKDCSSWVALEQDKIELLA